MQVIRTIQATVLLGLMASGPANATDCSSWSIGRSTEAYLAPLSVPPAKIGAYLSASQYAGGVKFKSWMKGKELWLDITDYPGSASAAMGPSSVMQVGRLAGPGFTKLVLADGGKGVFSVDEPALRSIGCQFIWGHKGGQNPIALMRMLFRSMKSYQTGQPLSTGFTGALLPDTNLALQINNKVFMPGWALSAVK